MTEILKVLIFCPVFLDHLKVTFQFNEEVNHAETHLCVFDLEGKLIDEKLIEPGQREIILDTRRYAPGIYCYMLNQATPGAQGKFVIVR